MKVHGMKVHEVNCPHCRTPIRIPLHEQPSMDASKFYLMEDNLVPAPNGAMFGVNKTELKMFRPHCRDDVVESTFCIWLGSEQHYASNHTAKIELDRVCAYGYDAYLDFKQYIAKQLSMEMGRYISDKFFSNFKLGE